MRIVNVVGARPNFVKIAPLIREMRRHPPILPLLVHTGQHYDGTMSEQFFAELEIQAPDFNLGVGSASHAAQEIFSEFPDLGIVPLFFTAFFYCRRCGGVANEKTCPHAGDRQEFSGNLLRRALTGEIPLPPEMSRAEVAAAIQEFPRPFVD